MEGISFYRDPQLSFIEAKLCRVKSICYKKHFHEEYSIGMINKGVSRMWCEGEELEVGAGRLIGIPPLLAHACNPDKRADWTYQMLFLQPGWIRQVLGEQVRWDGVRLLTKEASRESRLVLNHLIQLLRQGGSPLEAETWAICLMDKVLGGRKDDGLTGEEPEAASLTRAREYLHEHFAEKVTLEQLEEVSGISRYQLIRLFKKRHSLPPHAYQNLLRINYAKKRLHQMREIPISVTALEAGFYDQSHFSRVFKHCVGVTPQQYAGTE